jgi:hypothetical protein
MREVKRLKRIVAVRTTQRDISAMRLMEAKQQTVHAKDQLGQAERQLEEASQLVGAGVQLTPLDLERMDAARIAAWEEIAVWQVNKENAERAEETARSQVETQHLMLRQSERLGERAEQSHQKRLSAAERQLHDEQAGRAGREPF